MQHGGHITKDLLGPRGVPVGGGGAAFSPLDVDGLALWLDASDSTTLFQDAAGTTPASADGAVVGLWKDKSGNAHDVSQATTGNKPLLKLGILNSLNVIRFDGSDDVLTGAGFAFTSLTAFVVLQGVSNPPDIQTWVGEYKTTSDQREWRMAVNLDTVLKLDCYCSKLGTTADAVKVTPGAIGAKCIGILKHDGTTLSGYLNGGAAVTATKGLFNGTAALYVGNGEGFSQPAKGDAAEIIIYDSALDDTNRLLVLGYLNEKWAVF